MVRPAGHARNSGGPVARWSGDASGRDGRPAGL